MKGVRIKIQRTALGGRGVGDDVRFSRNLMGLQHTTNHGVVMPGHARGDFSLVLGLLSRRVIVLDIRYVALAFPVTKCFQRVSLLQRANGVGGLKYFLLRLFDSLRAPLVIPLLPPTYGVAEPLRLSLLLLDAFAEFAVLLILMSLPDQHRSLSASV